MCSFPLKPITCSPCLPHPVYTANGLLLSTDVKQRLDQQHVRCLDNVEPLGTGMERKQ